MEDMTIRSAPTSPQGDGANLASRQVTFAIDASRAEEASPIQSFEMFEPTSRSGYNFRSHNGAELTSGMAGTNAGPQDHEIEGFRRNWLSATCARIFNRDATHESNVAEANSATSQNLEDTDFFKDIIYKKVEEYPKCSIVQLAALLNADDGLCMFRSFGVETCRLLKIRTIEIGKLWQEIEDIDAIDRVEGADTAYRLHRVHQDYYEDRDLENKLNILENKLTKYLDLALKFVEMKSLEPPTDVQYNNIYKWVKRNGPICEEECHVMWKKHDFVTTRKRLQNHHRTGIEDKLEAFIGKHPNRCFNWLLQGEEEKAKTKDPRVHHYSSRGLARGIRLMITLSLICTTLLPIFIIFLVQPRREIIVSIVAAFVVLVMVTISLVIEVSAQEIFLGMAAYSAVLVALLSNLMNQGGR